MVQVHFTLDLEVPRIKKKKKMEWRKKMYIAPYMAPSG